MIEEIKSALNSISFINQLAVARKATIGDIIIEVKGSVNVQDALIIKNILLLLEQAGKLSNITRPIHIAGWVTVYNRNNAPETNNDHAIDAMRYAVGIDLGKGESKQGRKPEKKIKDINNKQISIKDVHIALNADKTDDLLQELMDFTMEPSQPEPEKIRKLPGGIPIEFLDDYEKQNNQVLAQKYNKGVATIRRWKRLIKQGGYIDESSK